MSRKGLLRRLPAPSQNGGPHPITAAPPLLRARVSGRIATVLTGSVTARATVFTQLASLKEKMSAPPQVTIFALRVETSRFRFSWPLLHYAI